MHDLKGQNKFDRISLSYGYTTSPLHINRTDVNRWLVFPTFEGGYRINEKIGISISYLKYDITLNKYSIDKFYLYSETPKLHSYQEAQIYIGNKIDPSEFNGYFLAGIHYYHFNTKHFSFQSVIQVSFRMAETQILEHVIERPSNPNGFEAHISYLTSDAIGVKLAIAPKIIIWDFLTLEASLGSFIFYNWPVLQPFGSIHVGISL